MQAGEVDCQHRNCFDVHSSEQRTNSTQATHDPAPTVIGQTQLRYIVHNDAVGGSVVPAR